MRINAWECAALEAGLGSVFSPELSATISWLLKIWANSYLMPQASVYSEVSPLINYKVNISFGKLWFILKVTRLFKGV